MRSAAECHVAVAFASEIDTQCVAELFVIEVRSPDQDRDHLSSLDRNVVERDILSHDSWHSGHRCLPTHQFLDGGGTERRIGDQAITLFRIGRQIGDVAAERRRYRIEPGEDQ